MKAIFAKTCHFKRSLGAGTLLLLLSMCGDSGEGGAPPRTDAEGDEKSSEPATAGNTGSKDDPADGESPKDAGAASAQDARVETARTDAAAPSKPVESPLPPPTPTEYQTAKTLVGSYAAMIKYRDVVTVGIAGTASMVTTVLAVAEIKDDSAAKVVRLAVNLCDAHIGTPTKHLDDLEVFIPTTALREARLDPAVLRATQADGKISWKTDEAHGVAGWKWASPMDQLPTRDDDARLVDQDGDGKPGVTARFTGHAEGSLYLALVYRFLFSGTAAANGDLTGSTTSTSREAMLGSSEILLLGMTIERAVDVEMADNTVRLVHQPSALSCEQLMAQKDALFR